LFDLRNIEKGKTINSNPVNSFESGNGDIPAACSDTRVARGPDLPHLPAPEGNQGFRQPESGRVAVGPDLYPDVMMIPTLRALSHLSDV